MPAVIFPDGARIAARSWRSLERRLRRDSWNPSYPPAFRAEMARRAKVWSGTRIVTEGSSRRFFEELKRARLLMIEEDLT